MNRCRLRTDVIPSVATDPRRREHPPRRDKQGYRAPEKLCCEQPYARLPHAPSPDGDPGASSAEKSRPLLERRREISFFSYEWLRAQSKSSAKRCSDDEKDEVASDAVSALCVTSPTLLSDIARRSGGAEARAAQTLPIADTLEAGHCVTERASPVASSGMQTGSAGDEE